MLLVHAPEPPTDAEWDAYVDVLMAQPFDGLVVWTDGVGPNAGQRKRLLARLGTREQLTAVITSSILARGIVTALSWVNVPIRAFSPNDVDAAIEFIGAGRDRDRVLRAGVALRLELIGADPASADELSLEEIAELASGSIARVLAFAQAARGADAARSDTAARKPQQS
jgi:hypothetical protein